MKKAVTVILSIFCWSTSSLLQALNEIFMFHGRARVCKGTLKDSEKGKTKGDYDHNENMTLTLSVPGAKSITLAFKNFCTEKDNDVLRIFDGKDTFEFDASFTLMRPRDLIQLCNISRSQATNRGGSSITRQDVKDATPQYSTW